MNNANHSTRTPKLSRYLGISYLLAGAVFLFDPFISVVDALPDCIGYLFVMLGLYRLADLDDRLAEAAKGARNLALVGIARVLAMLLAFGFVSPTERPVFMLLLLFTLGVLDCIVLIPMWKNFCGGLLYLGSRNGATTMFDRRTKRGKNGIYNVVERYTALTVGYFILKEILVILPELTVLTHEKGGVELGEGTRYYDFVGLFRVLSIFVALILGIVWLVLTVRMIKRLKRDEPFFESLRDSYRTDVLPRHELFAMRAVRASLISLIVATVLSLDFYMDSVNVVPDALVGIMLILSVYFLRGYAGKNIPALITSGAYGLLAALYGYMEYAYFSPDDLIDIFRKEELYDRWQTMLLLQVALSVLYALSVGLILRSLYRMVKKYTGLHAFREDSTYAAERTEAIHRLIRKKLVLVGIFLGVVLASGLFRWGVVPQMPEWEAGLLTGGSAQTQNTLITVIDTCYRLLAEGYWFLDLAFGGTLIGVTVSAMGEISDQMEYSYMMKD